MNSKEPKMTRNFDHLSNENKYEVQRLKEKAGLVTRICMNLACNNNVQKPQSHLLQENGILNLLADSNGQLMQQHFNAFKNMHFIDRGKNKIFKFNGYCNDCDNKIFETIEKKAPDFSKAETHYLFSLRPLTHELRKCEINLDWYFDLKKSNFYSEIKEIVDANITKYTERINYKKNYIANSFANSQSIVSKHRTLSYDLGVACTNTPMFNYRQYFFHLIPTKSGTVVSISTDVALAKKIDDGDYADWYVPEIIFKNIYTLDESTLIKYLSDTLLRYSEDWILSKNFYNDFIKPREQKIIKEMISGISIEYKNINYVIDKTINLFDKNT